MPAYCSRPIQIGCPACAITRAFQIARTQHFVHSTTGRYSDLRPTGRLLPIRSGANSGSVSEISNLRSQMTVASGISERCSEQTLTAARPSRTFTAFPFRVFQSRGALKPAAELCTSQRTGGHANDRFPGSSRGKLLFRSGRDAAGVRWRIPTGRVRVASTSASLSMVLRMRGSHRQAPKTPLVAATQSRSKSLPICSGLDAPRVYAEGRHRVATAPARESGFWESMGNVGRRCWREGGKRRSQAGPEDPPGT